MLSRLASTAVDIVFPKRCLICAAYGSHLCDDCEDHIAAKDKLRCIVCEQPTVTGATHASCLTRNTLDGLIAAGLFRQLQPLIHAYKYDLLQDLADPLARIFLDAINKRALAPFFSEFHLLPVPLHPSRLRWRGFDHTKALAGLVAENARIPFSPSVLARTRATIPQTSLDKPSRRLNMRGVFSCTDPSAVKGKNILLLDDIATTGTTLNECARVLKSAGVKKVWGLTLAHG